MSVFQFKRFSVDQNGCAMKINTDGVLLGALADANQPVNILDIGTGTGVIALMLAQCFPLACVHAVEIDEAAAQTALKNFNNAVFKYRLKLFASSFTTYFEEYPEKKYDLIVSNPPFHLNALKPASETKSLARHADEAFFDELVKALSRHITLKGTCQLVLPLSTSALVKGLLHQYGLHLQKVIAIRSFADNEPHREIITAGKENKVLLHEDFVIYAGPKTHSAVYRHKLKDFLTIF